VERKDSCRLLQGIRGEVGKAIRELEEGSSTKATAMLRQLYWTLDRLTQDETGSEEWATT
jgi:hypothetical protein